MDMSFDPLNYNFNIDSDAANKAAQKARNEAKKQLIKDGFQNVRGWRLTGQLRKYASFGVEDGRVRTIYYVSYDAYREAQ